MPFDSDVLLRYSHSLGAPGPNRDHTYGWFMIRINTEKTYAELVETEREKFHQHGVYMWITWTILAYVMLASRRYLKKYYNLSNAIHSFCGCVITLFTLIFGFKAVADLDWKIEKVKAHTFFGLFMLACILIIATLGAVQNTLSIYWQPP